MSNIYFKKWWTRSTTNLEKSIRVNGYIDHNEKNTMKPFWHVKHPAQKVMKRIKSYKSANVFLVHYSNWTTSRGTGPPPTQCIFNCTKCSSSLELRRMPNIHHRSTAPNARCVRLECCTGGARRLFLNCREQNMKMIFFYGNK